MSPHVLCADWNRTHGWGKPYFARSADGLTIPYGSSSLHYGLQCFEGMKAYLDKQGQVRLFRPDKNARRFKSSCERLTLPSFEEEEFIEMVKLCVRVDRNWIPMREGFSLYIRPLMIATEPTLGVGRPGHARLAIMTSPVGPYYPSGFKPIALMAEDRYVRAWAGGTGSFKVGGNYAPTIMVQGIAEEEAQCSQVLWLGPNGECTEAGAMNLMFVLKGKSPNTPLEVVTAPLGALVLSGVTRDSILTLLRKDPRFLVSERTFMITELMQHIKDDNVVEVFGCGTAAIVSFVKGIWYKGKMNHVWCDPDSDKSIARQLMRQILDIQYGVTPSDWSWIVN